MRGQSGLEGSGSQEIPQEKDPTYQDRKVAGVGEDGRGRRKAQGREDPTDERRGRGKGLWTFPELLYRNGDSFRRGNGGFYYVHY